MTLTIHIETGDDAFNTDPAGELSRIVRDQVIPAIRDGFGQRWLIDSNGNRVGELLVHWYDE